MPDRQELAKHYEFLSDAELLNLRGESGFTAEAEQVLAEELRHRGLQASDVQRQAALRSRIELRDQAQEKGFGSRGPSLQFFGRRYLNEDDRQANIQIRTKWFAFLGIPLVPLASYRFQCTETPGKWFGGSGGQRVLNRAPLNWPQIFLTWAKTAISILLVFLLAIAFLWYQRIRGR